MEYGLHQGEVCPHLFFPGDEAAEPDPVAPGEEVRQRHRLVGRGVRGGRLETGNSGGRNVAFNSNQLLQEPK